MLKLNTGQLLLSEKMWSLNWNIEMEHTNYWTEQLAEPLFPDIIWNKPQSKIHGPHLTLIGGYRDHFANISQAYSRLLAISTIINLELSLADSLKPLIRHLNLACPIYYLPTNKTGNLSLKAFETILEIISAISVIYLAGDLSNNSETILLIEQLIDNLTNIIFINSELLQSLLASDCNYLNKNNIVLFFNPSQLQKWLINSHFPMAFKSTMNLLSWAELLHQISLAYHFYLICTYQNQIFLAHRGQIYSQQLNSNLPIDQANYLIINAMAEQPNNQLKAGISGLIVN